MARPSSISIQPHFALIALLPNESHFSSNDSFFSGAGGWTSGEACAGAGVPLSAGDGGGGAAQ